MRARRTIMTTLVAGLLCGLLVACTKAEGAPTVRSDAVLESYRAPAGAPEFCSLLAGSRYVDDIPTAIGRLLADPRDTLEAWRLTAAAGEFEDVREEVRRDAGEPRLESALDDLIEALSVASAGPLTEPMGRRIVAGLHAVGRHAQPVCEFPA